MSYLKEEIYKKRGYTKERKNICERVGFISNKIIEGNER